MKSRLLAALAAALVAGAANAASEQFNFAVYTADFGNVGLLDLTESDGFDSASLWMYGSPRTSFYFTDPGSSDYRESGTIALQVVDGQLEHFYADFHICNDDTCHFGRFWQMEGDGQNGSLFILNYPDAQTYSLLPTIPEPANVSLLFAGLVIAGVAAGRKKTWARARRT